MVTRRQGKWVESGLHEKRQAVFDVVVCGGTLGVFLATALALRGMKVAIVEKGPLRGVRVTMPPHGCQTKGFEVL